MSATDQQQWDALTVPLATPLLEGQWLNERYGPWAARYLNADFFELSMVVL